MKNLQFCDRDNKKRCNPKTLMAAIPSVNSCFGITNLFGFPEKQSRAVIKNMSYREEEI